jgi:hypothetical protein
LAAKSAVDPIDFPGIAFVSEAILSEDFSFRLSAFRECLSAFAQVFRRVVGVTPTEFRSAL